MTSGSATRDWLRRVLFVACVILTSRPAYADAPVIEAGREADVLALFAPTRLGGEVAPGWRLWNVRIEASHVEVELLGPGGGVATVRLDHPNRAQASATLTRSFAVSRGSLAASGAARPATDALISAIARNDPGGFWRVERGAPLTGAEAKPAASAWLADGTMTLLAFASVLVWLALRALAQRPRARLVLAAIVIGAAVLRVVDAPQVALGPWPYSRLSPHVAAVWSGPAFATLGAAFGWRIHLSELMGWSTFAWALLAPLALFVWARRHVTEGTALAGAALMAALPQHLRFSRAETEYVPLLTLACASFALADVALRDDTWRSRVPAAVACAASIAYAIWLRPTAASIPVLLAISVAATAEVRRRDRGLIAAVVLGAAAAAIPSAIAQHSAAAGALIDSRWLGNAARAMVDPTWNSLLDPRVTPPAALALAALGAVVAWRRGRRNLALVLLAWIVTGIAAHAVVVQPPMHARYHLQVVPPFVLLAAIGLGALFAWRRWAAAIAGALLFSAPLVHRGFVRDLAYDDLREWEFVRSARDLVPDGCSVVEYVGERRGEARFDRMGQLAERGARRSRFVSTGLASAEDPIPQAECTYLYRGLACWVDRRGDEPMAPACRALERAGKQEVATARFPSRPYHEGWKRRDEPSGEIELALYRVSPGVPSGPGERAAGAASEKAGAPRHWPPELVWTAGGGAVLWMLWMLARALRAGVLARRETRVLLALLGGFLLLATTLPQMLPLHEHSTFVARSDCARQLDCVRDPRGPAWSPHTLQLYGVLLRLLPPRVTNLGWISLATTVVSLVLLHVLVRRVLARSGAAEQGARIASWAVAFAAFHPVFLRVAVSDTFWPYTMVCLLGAGVALLEALDGRSATAGVVAAALFGLAVASNVAALTLTPLLVIAPLCWGGRPRWRWLLPAAAAALLAAPWIIDAVDVTARHATAQRFGLREVLAASRPLYFHAEVTPAPLAVLAAVGLVLSLRRSRALAPIAYATLVLVPALSLQAGPPIGPSYPVGLLLGFPTLYGLAVLAAVGLEGLRERVAPVWRARLVTGLTCLTLLFLVACREGLGLLRGTRVLERELVALSRAFASLPPHDVLVVPPLIQRPVLPLEGSDPVEAVFPAGEYRWAMVQRGIPSAPIVEADRFLEREPRPGERVLLYLGVTLRSFLKSEIAADVVPPDLERPALARLRSRYRLEPVHEFQIETAQHPAISMRLAADRTPSVKLGFYWLVRR